MGGSSIGTLLQDCLGTFGEHECVVGLADVEPLVLRRAETAFGIPPLTDPDGPVSACGPALLRVLDRLSDTPAPILSSLGEVLVRNRLTEALHDGESEHTGLARSDICRWFTGPAEG